MYVSKISGARHCSHYRFTQNNIIRNFLDLFVPSFTKPIRMQPHTLSLTYFPICDIVRVDMKFGIPEKSAIGQVGEPSCWLLARWVREPEDFDARSICVLLVARNQGWWMDEVLLISQSVEVQILAEVNDSSLRKARVQRANESREKRRTYYLLASGEWCKSFKLM